jgi:predicted nucleic acid-binding protein
MTLFYLDASAWVEYYVVETGSDWLDGFWNLRVPIACSDLGLIEVLATLARRQKQKAALSGSYPDVVREVQRHFRAIKGISLDSDVMMLACAVADKYALRGADSIHLASAIWLREKLGATVTMIASDAELLAAALLEGFATLDPNKNPPLPIVP